MRDDNGSAIIFAVVCTVAALVGGAIANSFTTESWRSDAIKRGYAEYNQTTGGWQWKTNAVRVEAGQ